MSRLMDFELGRTLDAYVILVTCFRDRCRWLRDASKGLQLHSLVINKRNTATLITVESTDALRSYFPICLEHVVAQKAFGRTTQFSNTHEIHSINTACDSSIAAAKRGQNTLGAEEESIQRHSPTRFSQRNPETVG